jgi:hypothetical protein
MRKFCRPVDKDSRRAMTAYLAGHFRYNTMNSWNQSTSYACNMKLYRLGLSKDVENKLYDMIRIEEFYEPLNDLMREFGADHDYQWQVGMNGKNSGYLVLYQGALEPSGYKSYCTRCGQRNYTSVNENNNICGACHESARLDYPRTHVRVTAYPCRSTDDGEDYKDWSLDELRNRVSLIQDFDRLADAMVAEAIVLAKNYDVREETYLVEKTRPLFAPVI